MNFEVAPIFVGIMSCMISVFVIQNFYNWKFNPSYTLSKRALISIPEELEDIDFENYMNWKRQKTKKMLNIILFLGYFVSVYYICNRDKDLRLFSSLLPATKSMKNEKFSGKSLGVSLFVFSSG